jgi:hypothetical protein
MLFGDHCLTNTYQWGLSTKMHQGQIIANSTSVTEQWVPPGKDGGKWTYFSEQATNKGEWEGRRERGREPFRDLLSAGYLSRKPYLVVYSMDRKRSQK